MFGGGRRGPVRGHQQEMGARGTDPHLPDARAAAGEGVEEP